MTGSGSSGSWPTATANDWKGSGPTLERADGKMRGDRLDYATEQIWSTPRSSGGEKGGPNQSFGAGGIPLPAQAGQWYTPNVPNGGRKLADSNGARNRTSGRQEGSKHHDGVTLNDAIILFSLPAPETWPDGGKPSPERRSLNPLFVEWLMGWPPGWTLLALPASIGSACSETALCLWKARMRSALCSLPSPIAAPPAQLSFLEA